MGPAEHENHGTEKHLDKTLQTLSEVGKVLKPELAYMQICLEAWYPLGMYTRHSTARRDPIVPRRIAIP